MSKGMTLVTTALVALAFLPANATPERPTSATTPPAASVISLSIVPTSERADLVIGEHLERAHPRRVSAPIS